MPLVLVVEDEAEIADAVVARLRTEGFDARAVGDGLEAVEQCRRLRPDLVVLDLMLPGLDGLEVCRRIQSDRRVPVVMLTARDDETDVLVGLSVGADDYVAKPFSPAIWIGLLLAAIALRNLGVGGGRDWLVGVRAVDRHGVGGARQRHQPGSVRRPPQPGLSRRWGRPRCRVPRPPLRRRGTRDRRGARWRSLCSPAGAARRRPGLRCQPQRGRGPQHRRVPGGSGASRPLPPVTESERSVRRHPIGG